MSEKLGEAPTPAGAPEVAPEPGPYDGFDVGRPRLGGLEHPVEFTEGQTAVLGAVADTLIPPGDGFPAPSEVDIVTFIGRYLAPRGYRARHYPFAAEDEFTAAVDRLGDAFVAADPPDRAETLARLEERDETFFGQLRSLVYYGYYATTEVTLAIRKNLPAGRDYHGPPQPYGYLDCIEPWDAETLDAAGGNTGYLATEDVERVDLSTVTWITNGAAS